MPELQFSPRWLEDELKKLQIEPTTFCTLDCEYCHRKNIPPRDIPLEVLDRVEGLQKNT